MHILLVIIDGEVKLQDLESSAEKAKVKYVEAFNKFSQLSFNGDPERFFNTGCLSLVETERQYVHKRVIISKEL